MEKATRKLKVSLRERQSCDRRWQWAEWCQFFVSGHCLGAADDGNFSIHFSACQETINKILLLIAHLQGVHLTHLSSNHKDSLESFLSWIPTTTSVIIQYMLFFSLLCLMLQPVKKFHFETFLNALNTQFYSEWFLSLPSLQSIFEFLPIKNTHWDSFTGRDIKLKK